MRKKWFARYTINLMRYGDSMAYWSPGILSLVNEYTSLIFLKSADISVLGWSSIEIHAFLLTLHASHVKWKMVRGILFLYVPYNFPPHAWRRVNWESVLVHFLPIRELRRMGDYKNSVTEWEAWSLGRVIIRTMLQSREAWSSMELQPYN